MAREAPATLARMLCVARAGYGLVLLLQPDRGLGATGGPVPTRDARQVVRILGLRQVLQAAATWARPTRGTVEVGAVDVLHAATAFGYAALGGSRPRAGWASGAISVAAAAGGLLAAQPGREAN